jgi:hypothetical protein
MTQSQADEVPCVSRVVTDLVAGADLKFSERGLHEFNGLPRRWDLFCCEQPAIGGTWLMSAFWRMTALRQ